MSHRKTTVAWLALNIVVLVLYTCVPSVFFNNGRGRIAGMPEMLFWFSLLPLVIPALMQILYVYDKKVMRRVRPATQSQDGDSR